ncbi:MAG TPA: class I SAM-dependent methyltransferase [Gemmatimonadaceae bacterium]|nr:class I SAM-dependent methyltransferase [Gemmatimonadaceae bacterium]
MATLDTYDAIGRSYSTRRRPDQRLAARLDALIGSDRTVLNVGAGTGSYEPARSGVVAVEPSTVMLSQRPASAAPAVRAIAEALPFPDQAFDVVLAILTVHHWKDQRRGLEECARAAKDRVVILTWDPDAEGFWLVKDYFPEILAIDRRIFPSMELLSAVLGPIDVQPLPIPGDCIDGFLGAYWQRPEAYLDEEVRARISSFSLLTSIGPQLERLERDLMSGNWERRNAELRLRPELDVGYRLVTAQRRCAQVIQRDG